MTTFPTQADAFRQSMAMMTDGPKVKHLVHGNATCRVCGKSSADAGPYYACETPGSPHDTILCAEHLRWMTPDKRQLALFRELDATPVQEAAE